jgi:hemoglobin
MLYDDVGGMAFFERLVDVFYTGVESDPVLLSLYPHPEDLAGARHRLTLFLAQYWGGPTTYSDERGHPRLRMRHMGFRIGEDARDRWLRHMLHAVDIVATDPGVRQALRDYFVPAANHLRNDGPLNLVP